MQYSCDDPVHLHGLLARDGHSNVWPIKNEPPKKAKKQTYVYSTSEAKMVPKPAKQLELPVNRPPVDKQEIED